MGAPLIGIPSQNKGGSFALRRAYSLAVAAAGGLPVLLPLIEDERILRPLYERLDGLLLSGGGDVAAAHYGAAEGRRPRSVDPPRDRVELRLARWAVAEGLPILGICRGIQLLNVAAGGTLIQDIPSALAGAPTSVEHDSASDEAHSVALSPGSLLADILSAGEEPRSIAVNSRHHQAVDQVAPHFVAVARAPDGIIEGIERAQAEEGFAVGVQWHPEDLAPHNARMARLFRRFVAACRR